MAYTTVSEVRLALAPSVSDPANPPAEETHTAADLTNSQIQDAINEAASTIDSFIGGRYIVPVPDKALDDPTVPHPIDFWTRNLAAYLATLTYRGNQDVSDNDPIARRNAATYLALAAVRDGKAPLPGLTELGSGGGGGGVGQSEGASAPFQQYDGQLFSPDDFDLVPDLLGDMPRWWWR